MSKTPKEQQSQEAIAHTLAISTATEGIDALQEARKGIAYVRNCYHDELNRMDAVSHDSPKGQRHEFLKVSSGAVIMHNLEVISAGVEALLCRMKSDAILDLSRYSAEDVLNAERMVHELCANEEPI